MNSEEAIAIVKEILVEYTINSFAIDTHSFEYEQDPPSCDGESYPDTHSISCKLCPINIRIYPKEDAPDEWELSVRGAYNSEYDNFVLNPMGWKHAPRVYDLLPLTCAKVKQGFDSGTFGGPPLAGHLVGRHWEKHDS